MRLQQKESIGNIDRYIAGTSIHRAVGGRAGVYEDKRGVTPYYVSMYCFQRSRFRVSLDICCNNIVYAYYYELSRDVIYVITSARASRQFRLENKAIPTYPIHVI